MAKFSTTTKRSKKGAEGTPALSAGVNVSTAELKSHNQTPRKVRLVTDLVKGKSVAQAINVLSFLPKRASDPIKKLIQSAAANAKAKGENVETLKVKNILVDSAGMVVKYVPRAMGRGAPVRHRKSRIIVTLSA